MGLFFVRNLRQRHTLTMYGRTLAPAAIGGRTSVMALSLEQLLSDTCVNHIKSGNLILQGPMPDELAARLSDGGPADVPTPLGESSPSVTEAPAVEPPAPVEPAVEVAQPQIENSEPEVVVSADEKPRNTAESLKALTVSELRKIAKGYKIKSSGTEDELIQRILDHEAGES